MFMKLLVNPQQLKVNYSKLKPQNVTFLGFFRIILYKPKPQSNDKERI
jgi:hypothetical protein